MDDYGALYADKRIETLERRLRALFSDAHQSVLDKYRAYIRRFVQADKLYRKKLKAGEISKATYEAWLRGQVFQGERWRAQLADLARTLTQTTQAAMDIINDSAPGVFAENANWATYEIERAGNIDTGFGLYDETSVKRLIRDNPNLLPASRVDIPRDEAWNMELITRQIGAGIVTGEGLEAIAKRLRRVANMSLNQSRTHAQTAMTGAQNAGRVESYRRAESMNIALEKEWLATLDGHTRRAHRLLDGQHVPVDKPFHSELGDIMFPGDPDANPSNVYNCRCTLVARLIEYPSKNAKRRPNEQNLGDDEEQKPIHDMNYQEWVKWKKRR